MFQDEDMLLLRHFPAPLSYCSQQLIDITHTEEDLYWGFLYGSFSCFGIMRGGGAFSLVCLIFHWLCFVFGFNEVGRESLRNT